MRKEFFKRNDEFLDAIQCLSQKISQWNDLLVEKAKKASALFDEAKEKYEVAENQIALFLEKYKFLITPGLSLDFVVDLFEISEKEFRGSAKAVRDAFYVYFSKNNWENLEELVTEWRNNMVFKKRMLILTSCVETIKGMDKKINVVYVVLPTLISQIDGIISDYLELYGVKWRKKLKEKRPEVLTNRLDELADIVIEDILFKPTKKKGGYERQIQFNRNSIVHGEKTDYGRKDYLIRCFLVLDFLAYVETDTSIIGHT